VSPGRPPVIPPLGPSDKDRSDATDRLQAAFAAGRLDLLEFEARLDAILRATNTEEFRAATHDLPVAASPSRARLGRRRRIAIIITAGVTIGAGIGISRMGDNASRPVPPPAAAPGATGDINAQRDAALIDRARREHWADSCPVSASILQQYQRPRSPDVPAGRTVDLIPAAPWPDGEVSFDGLIAPLAALPPQLAAPLLDHQAIRAVGRTYFRDGTVGGATVRVFDFPDDAAAQSAQRDYVNATVCVFGGQPFPVTGLADVVATRTPDEVAATWTVGRRLVQVTASGFADREAAVAAMAAAPSAGRLGP
jgi:hypothetical protein